MIYLVDNTIDGQGPSPRELHRVLSGMLLRKEIVMEPYHAVNRERVKQLAPTHVVLSGQSHPWDLYPPEKLAGIFEVIKDASQPILGVCGGHQQMALAFEGRVGLMERLTPGEGYEGAKRERGFLPVETSGNGIFTALPAEITVWHSHCDEVKELPDGFERTAWNATCQIQAMQHSEKPLFGLQFHPELFDEQNPQGRQVLENFFRLN